jgi:uncharacterized coiled-coil DUF342 family protein
MDKVTELKAQAYDTLAKMEMISKQMKELDTELNNINSQIAELYKTEEAPKVSEEDGE